MKKIFVMVILLFLSRCNTQDHGNCAHKKITLKRLFSREHKKQCDIGDISPPTSPTLDSMNTINSKYFRPITKEEEKTVKKNHQKHHKEVKKMLKKKLSSINKQSLEALKDQPLYQTIGPASNSRKQSKQKTFIQKQHRNLNLQPIYMSIDQVQFERKPNNKNRLPPPLPPKNKVNFINQKQPPIVPPRPAFTLPKNNLHQQRTRGQKRTKKADNENDESAKKSKDEFNSDDNQMYVDPSKLNLKPNPVK